MPRAAIGALILLASSNAAGEVLVVPEPATATAAVALPARGTTMAEVERRYGAPLARSSAGGTGPRQPLIHRWDYEGFSVFFEKEFVIDAVIPGAPPPVAHKDRLIVE